MVLTAAEHDAALERARVRVERAAVIAALKRVLAGARIEEEVPRTLRMLQSALDNDGRKRVARRITATGILRLRLAHLAGAEDADALLDAYIEHEENALEEID